MEEQIKEVLEEIRPHLRADGGDVEFLDFQDGVVTVRFKGACDGCPMAEITLKQVIETAIKKAVPEVSQVVAHQHA